MGASVLARAKSIYTHEVNKVESVWVHQGVDLCPIYR